MKYKLLTTQITIRVRHEDRTLYRIQALKNFGDVKAGDLGGWVEGEWNLSQEDLCWVYGEGKVYGNARVSENAEVSGNARVYGSAWVYGIAEVSENAVIFGYAIVYGNARVSGNAQVSGEAEVSGNAQVSGKAKLTKGKYTTGTYTGKEEVKEESLDIVNRINKVLGE